MCREEKFHLIIDSSRDKRIKNATPIIVRFVDKKAEKDPENYCIKLETNPSNKAITHFNGIIKFFKDNLIPFKNCISV